jgi:hypothetical protein
MLQGNNHILVNNLEENCVLIKYYQPKNCRNESPYIINGKGKKN